MLSRTVDFVKNGCDLTFTNSKKSGLQVSNVADGWL